MKSGLSENRIENTAQLRLECEAFFARMWPDGSRTLVFGEGNTGAPELMLIGEAPGEQETLLKRPFVGKAGRNLDAFLQMVSLSREDIYITNTVKIRPYKISAAGRMSNRAPSREEIELFLPWLRKEISVVAPRAIVTLGNVPLRALMGPQAAIGAMHGRWHKTVDGQPLFALYHPASVIYRRELTEVYTADVLRLRETMTT